MLHRWLPVVSAVCQLAGTALILWGLRIKPSEQMEEGRDDGTVRRHAIVWKEHPCAFVAGVALLLLGLALQVVVAVLQSLPK